MSTSTRPALQTAADSLWDRYLSCVRTGGTPDQRQSAFERWVDADRKLARHDRRVEKLEGRDRAQANTETLPVVGGAA